MSEARTITIELVRNAMRSHCADGKTMSNAELYCTLNLIVEKEKERLRARVNDMVKRGELVRIAPGLYEYNFEYRIRRKNTTFPVIWRFVRMNKPGWTITDVCQLTRISYTQVSRYCNWLEEEKYIVRHGKKGTAVAYKATKKADLAPETPYPDITDRNPFERENAAAAELARLMLCHNPYQETTARKIVKACNVLLARFDKNSKQNENGASSNA